jgi:uncharacterized membrane protein YgdD (TMEM256/DUF423 family)
MHRESIWLYPIGSLLILIGFSLMMYGLFSSGAPPFSDTLNIGLLNDKSNLTLIGGFAFLGGLVCLALESAVRRLIDAVRHR